jgi:6-phosphogluconolactonase
MEIHIAQDASGVTSQLAAWIADYIDAVLARQDRFTFVLSGGNTPKSLYGLLASPPYLERIPWEKIHFFWGDERAVPYDDDRNNARMCFEALLDKVAVRLEHIHVMRTDITPALAAQEYEQILNTYFGDSGQTFDFVLLGMGDDGHTLSLFPGMDVVRQVQKNVDTFYLPAQDMSRITLTAPIVNRASCVAFMATGAGKAVVLKSVLEGARNVDLFPSQIIWPEEGTLHWFVDEAAAALLVE